MSFFRDPERTGRGDFRGERGDLRREMHAWRERFRDEMHAARGGRGGRHGGGGGWGGGPGGGGPGGGPPFPGMGPWSIFGLGRRPRARRGDLRSAILTLLAEQPRNGYQIMQEIEQRSRGLWRPSPGSVYPALQQLEDEGLIKSQSQESGTGKIYELTKRGKDAADELDPADKTPWASLGDEGDDEMLDLVGVFKSVAAAAMQVLHAGSPTQRAEARKILIDARRALYRILSEDEAADEP
jgi:DNA-binding PadR family transcriptional regulator